jgi:cell division septal protein FtsQ
MLNKKGLIFFFLIPIFLGCSNNNDQQAIILFEGQPSLKEEQDLILNLNSYIYKNNLLEFLNTQNWIETFLIKRHVFRPLEIFIKSKEPKYIWKDKFYLDKSLSKFLYFGEHPSLLNLYMPIEFVDKWLEFEDQFQSTIQLNNLKIDSVAYTEAEGWYFIIDTNIRINLGTDLSDSVIKKLTLTLKYIFEKNLTPSIIDLRYKDGAALNYGK